MAIIQRGKSTAEEKESLNIITEESAEVIQGISKVLRFGWESCAPGSDETNREHLTEEIGDLICMIGILMSKNVIDKDAVRNHMNLKTVKLAMYSDINMSDVKLEL